MDTPLFNIESTPGAPVDLSPLVGSRIHLFRNGRELTEGKDYRLREGPDGKIVITWDVCSEVEAMDWPDTIGE